MNRGLNSGVIWVVTLVAMLALDSGWLLLVANDMFRAALGGVMRTSPDLGAAAAFYLIYAAGIVVLAVMPSVKAASVREAALRGAALGLTAYATFDLSNLAVIRGWTAGIALADMAWGTFATAAAAAVGASAGHYLRRR